MVLTKTYDGTCIATYDDIIQEHNNIRLNNQDNVHFNIL